MISNVIRFIRIIVIVVIINIETINITIIIILLQASREDSGQGPGGGDRFSTFFSWCLPVRRSGSQTHETAPHTCMYISEI